MNVLQRGLITLLKSGITGQCCALPEGFSLEAAEPLLKKHHMANLVYMGACHCGISKETPLMQSLFIGYCREMVRSQAQMDAAGKIFAAFDASGIDYMPLKGSKLKGLYPAPELRYMGDADILIHVEQYPKIVPIMQSLGFTPGKESDHELVWRSKALIVELHKRLIPSYNEDYAPYFGDGWGRAKPEYGTRYTMTTEDEFVFLFTHFTKHYRDGGIGCRYVADLWLYRRANPQMDEAYIRRELESLGLLEFYENVLHLMAAWFEDAPSSVKMDFMTEFIFASGSWGAVESRVLSAAVKDTNHSGGRGGKRKYLARKLFPGVNALKHKYTVLQKHPGMLPLVWVYRPFYKVLFERRSLTRKQKNLDAITEENIASQKQMLNYVGLDYHF